MSDVQLNNQNEHILAQKEAAKAPETDDALLVQIDEFRAKAQQLQQLLLSKETKVKELQVIVDEREDKAEELRKIVEEQQEKADGITVVVGKQIDSLIEKVSAKLDEIETSVGGTIADGQKADDERMEQARQSLSQILHQLDVLKADLSSKVHSESVKSYRNISDLIKKMNESLQCLETLEVLNQRTRMLKAWTIVISAVSIGNLIGIIVLILLGVGII